MSRAVLFLGPSLPAADLPNDPRLAVLPPAAQGDVLIALRDLAPAAIGLIDGCFEGEPAVLHKELLSALHAGVSVIGGGSMGALRAAELAAFGMTGAGEIYQAFAKGELDGDDEVAVLHGPAELGWLPLSEALVNTRATLDAARGAGVLGQAEAERLLELAHARFYKERSWPRLYRDARDAGLEPEPLERFVAANRVDLKREDARAVIAGVLAALDRPPPEAPRWTFERTAAFAEIEANARARADDALRRADLALRQRFDLTTGAAWRAWLQANGTDREGWLRMVRKEAMRRE